MPAIEFTIDQADVPDEVFNTVMAEVFDLIVSATPVRTGFAQDSWKLDGDTISNNCEYISYLEDGWSDQAPNGMVGPALDALPDILAAAMADYNSANMNPDGNPEG